MKKNSLKKSRFFHYFRSHERSELPEHKKIEISVRVLRNFQNVENVGFRFDSGKNQYFWSKNRYFESILFFAIRFSLGPILYRQHRNRNGRAVIQRFGILKLMTFFLGTRFFLKTVWKCYGKLVVILVIIFKTVFSKNRIKILLALVIQLFVGFSYY